MLIKITDASYTTYSLEKSGWFMLDGTEVCGLKAVCLLRQAIGVYGLTGVDRLLVSCANLTLVGVTCNVHLNSTHVLSTVLPDAPRAASIRQVFPDERVEAGCASRAAEG